ncbi:MAG: hypothetical protein ACLFMO_05025 [Eubacteriales bacterium]
MKKNVKETKMRKKYAVFIPITKAVETLFNKVFTVFCLVQVSKPGVYNQLYDQF